NPGGTMGFGAAIYDPSGREIWHASGTLPARPTATCNGAEYMALATALRGLIELGFQQHEIEICVDSKLVIHQMRGTWRIRKGEYVNLANQAKALLGRFPRARFRWIPREQNRRADELSKAHVMTNTLGIFDETALSNRRAATQNTP